MSGEFDKAAFDCWITATEEELGWEFEMQEETAEEARQRMTAEELQLDLAFGVEAEA